MNYLQVLHIKGSEKRIMLMICLDFQFCAIHGVLNKWMINLFISVLLDAAGQPENIDGEN